MLALWMLEIRKHQFLVLKTESHILTQGRFRTISLGFNLKILFMSSRVRLEYGGADVTQTFHWLLQKCAFPYKECNEKMPQDAMLLKSLKEEFCNVNLVRLSTSHG